MLRFGSFTFRERKREVYPTLTDLTTVVGIQCSLLKGRSHIRDNGLWAPETSGDLDPAFVLTYLIIIAT